MVTVIGVQTRKNSKNEEFSLLVLQGGIEVVKSKQTGKQYFTAKKCAIPSTFDAQTAQSFVGSKMPGVIEKKPCEPYEFTIKETGEVIELDYVLQYNASPNTIEETVMADFEMA